MKTHGTREQRARIWVLIVGFVVVAICAVRAIAKYSDGDFKLHWEFGRRFVAGEFLYHGGHNLPYLPFWAMAHAPVSLPPLPIAKALLFPLGVAAVVGLLWVLRRLAAPVFNLDERQAFWTAVLAVGLTIRYLIRDMAEVGVNTTLVLLTWLGIYLWRRERDELGALSLGAAIALKCTPALFAFFFLWKRQWRMALLTAAAALAFTVAPLLWQGPALYFEHMRTWITNVLYASAAGDITMLGADQSRNMSLGALFGLGLLVVVLWWSRAAVESRDDPRVLWEFSAIGIVALFLSPITWGQHCVALLPACYLIGAVLITRSELPRWMLAFLGFYVLSVLVLNRGLLGRELSLRLASFHVESFAILALLVIVLRCRRFA